MVSSQASQICGLRLGYRNDETYALWALKAFQKARACSPPCKRFAQFVKSYQAKQQAAEEVPPELMTGSGLDFEEEEYPPEMGVVGSEAAF